MSVLKFLLLPLAWIYHLVTAIRNHLFNIGHFRSFQFETVVISVGNLNAGGSGKTPMVEYLIRLLAHRYKVVVLSRGYGRGTQGYRLAHEQDSAITIGDEPYQIFMKFKDQIKVAVGEERALAIPSILNDCPDTEVIILDDAYQHRTVIPDFSILLTTFDRPFYEDYLLPMGRLRESKPGASRSNAVVVTKCPPELKIEKLEAVQTEVSMFTKSPVFFASIQYQTPISFAGLAEIQPRQSVILVSGIANSKLLKEQVAKQFNLVKHFDYADHHRFTKEEIQVIQQEAIQFNALVVTTAKDRAKLVANNFASTLNKEMWWEIPMESVFLNHGSDFDRMILQAVEQKKVSMQYTVEE